MRFRTVLLVLVAALSGPAMARTSDAPDTCLLERESPPDALEFMQRFAGCKHWSGEDGYDDERAKEIETALADLRCDDLEADEAALRARYDDQPVVLALIDRGKEEDGWAGCPED
jgi:hypothetical protein